MVEFAPYAIRLRIQLSKVTFLPKCIQLRKILWKKSKFIMIWILHNPVAWIVDKHVVLNKSMCTGKKCQKLKHVCTFIWYTRVGSNEKSMFVGFAI